MKILIAAVSMIVAAVSLAETETQSISADRLLHDVVAQMPSRPLSITGTLLVRKRHGVPVAKYNFNLETHWGAQPPRATYTISDAFGRPLEQLSIIHGTTNSYHYAVGADLKPAKLKSLAASIRQTDLSWLDLTLAFLWWDGGKIIGEDSVLSIDCYVVVVKAPPGSHSPYASVKLWIGKKTRMMLQAEGYDAKGHPIRKLWVRSGQKIDGDWMIKNMEIQQYPVVHRTKLRVLEVNKKPLETNGSKQKPAATKQSTRP